MDELARFHTLESFPAWLCRYQIAEPGRATYSAKKYRPAPPPSPAESRKPLQDSIRQLRLAQSVITVAIAALRRQNADNDADVADVLERYASDRLDIEIEKLEEMRTTDRADQRSE